MYFLLNLQVFIYILDDNYCIHFDSKSHMPKHKGCFRKGGVFVYRESEGGHILDTIVHRLIRINNEYNTNFDICIDFD